MHARTSSINTGKKYNGADMFSGGARGLNGKGNVTGSGTSDEASFPTFQILFSFQSSSTFMSLICDYATHSWILTSACGGVEDVLAQAIDLDIRCNQFYEVLIQLRGSTFSIDINGNPVFTSLRCPDGMTDLSGLPGLVARGGTKFAIKSWKIKHVPQANSIKSKGNPRGGIVNANATQITALSEESGLNSPMTQHEEQKSFSVNDLSAGRILEMEHEESDYSLNSSSFYNNTSNDYEGFTGKDDHSPLRVPPPLNYGNNTGGLDESLPLEVSSKIKSYDKSYTKTTNRSGVQSLAEIMASKLDGIGIGYGNDNTDGPEEYRSSSSGSNLSPKNYTSISASKKGSSSMTLGDMLLEKRGMRSPTSVSPHTDSSSYPSTIKMPPAAASSILSHDNVLEFIPRGGGGPGKQRSNKFEPAPVSRPMFNGGNSAMGLSTSYDVGSNRTSAGRDWNDTPLPPPAASSAFSSNNHSNGNTDESNVDNNDNNNNRDEVALCAQQLLQHHEKGVVETVLRDVVQHDLGIEFADIAALDVAKRLLSEAVILPLMVPEFFTGIREPWKGVLLFGPPGTGKTLLAKAVCSLNQSTFFNCPSSTLVSKYRGESEKIVRCLFEAARLMAPAVVFMDEVDALVGSRSEQGEHEASRRLKTELFSQMDGISSSNGGNGKSLTANGVMVLATTNCPWDLDDAMRRRLEKRIFIPMPDHEARQALLDIYLKHITLSENVDIKRLCDMTEGYSGADMHVVCREAAMMPMRKLLQVVDPSQIQVLRSNGQLSVQAVEMEDFVQAVANTKTSVGADTIGKYATWMATYGSS
jgi:katanin p60 ATPase-containing subunit A1